MKKLLAQIESKNKQTTGGTRTGPAGSMRSDLNSDTQPEENYDHELLEKIQIAGNTVHIH